MWAPIGIESQVVHFGKYLIKNSPLAHKKKGGGIFALGNHLSINEKKWV